MKYSQMFFLLLALSWFVVPFSPSDKIIYLGIIVLYLAIHNFIGFKLAQQDKTTMKKYDFFVAKFGTYWGSKIYLILFISLPVGLALFIIWSALTFR